MSPFDCSDSCRTVRGPQEPAWSRGFYARVCDVSLTLCVCACFVPGGHGTGHLCRDVCRNTIMCTCALWRPPHMAAARKVLPLRRLRADEGGTLLQGPAQRFYVNRDPSLSTVWRTYLQMAMGSILLQSKAMSFMPVDRAGQRGERWQDMVYIHTAQGGWRS